MLRVAASMGLLFAVLLAFGLAGCNSKGPDSSSSPPAEQSTGGHDNHAEHSRGEHADHGEHGQSAMDKMKAELAKLSPEDAASAERQHFCPVTGEMLGTMGAPKKIDVNGQQVWICCDNCTEKLLANPDEYLAKLKKG